jgi:putative transposase
MIPLANYNRVLYSGREGGLCKCVEPLGAEPHGLQLWEERLALARFSGHLYRCSDCAILHSVKLIAQLKLLPSSEQAELLTCMLTTVNAACDYISRVAWETSVFREYALRKIVYADVRGTFGLGAQVAQHCVAKVTDTYKVDKKRLRTFAPLGSIAFDDRNLLYNIKGSSVSIWTISGRQSIPFACGEHQRKLLEMRQGESDLVFVRGNWYVLATCQVDEPDPLASEEVLGIDLGVTNIAVDSDGEVHSGKPIKNVRYRQRRLRNKLQRLRTFVFLVGVL